MAATDPIETSPTSPETCGLEMKQSYDTVNIRRVHLVQGSHQLTSSFFLNKQ